MRGLVAQDAAFAPVPHHHSTIPGAPEVETVPDVSVKGFASEARACAAHASEGDPQVATRHRGVGDRPWPRGPLWARLKAACTRCVTGGERVASLMDAGPETHPRPQHCDIASRGGHAPYAMMFLGVINVERRGRSIASSAVGGATRPRQPPAASRLRPTCTPQPRPRLRLQTRPPSFPHSHTESNKCCRRKD